MKKILVPIDFSDNARHALQYAFRLASNQQADVVLYHVIYPNQGLDNNVYEMFWDDYAEERRSALRNLAEKESAAFAGVTTETVVEIGFPVDSINHYCHKHRIDLIVMGAVGATNLETVILGSTTTGVALRLKTPTLVVPQASSAGLGDKFVLATNFKVNLNAASGHVLRAITEQQGADLDVLHVLDDSTAGPLHVLEQQLRHHLDLPFNMHYLHSESVPQAVHDFAETTHASLLIVVSHEHGFWYKLVHENKVKQLLMKTRLPILVLHE